jgi:NAD-dependent deacetylase
MVSNKLLSRLKNLPQLTVLTGEKMAFESGLPPLLGTNGILSAPKNESIWKKDSLKKDPLLFWEFYKLKEKYFSKAKPNLGHYALVDFENRLTEFTLLTQNFDGLHTLAGNTKTLELYGNINQFYCSSCQYEDDMKSIAVNDTKTPKCPKCSSIIRPNLILSDENIDKNKLQSAQTAAAICEVFFAIGVEELTEPVASLPYIAKGNGAYIVEINTHETALTSTVDEFIQEAPSKILPLLFVVMEKIWNN